MKVRSQTGKDLFYQLFIGDGTAKPKLGFQGFSKVSRNIAALSVFLTPSQFSQTTEANHEFPTLTQISLRSFRLRG